MSPRPDARAVDNLHYRRDVDVALRRPALPHRYSGRVQNVERVDLPGAVDVAGAWYGVTDAGRTLHVVLGEVTKGAPAVCGQAVDREVCPLDARRLCRRCDSRYSC